MNRSLLSIALLLLVGTGLFLFDPGNTTFYSDDEWLYIGAASEMFNRGEVWIPYWLGEPAYYKPPLSYWMMMPFFLFEGDRVLQGRLAIGLTSVLTILLVYVLGRTLYGEKQGLMAGLISATSLGFLTYGRVGMLDMPLTFCMTLAATCLMMAWKKGSGAWAGLFWAVSGASVLVKGPVSAVILFVLCVLSGLFYGGWRKLFFSRGALTGMLAAVVCIASWPAALYLKGEWNHWFNFFIIGENLGKFSDPTEYPIGKFLSYALQWILPWTLPFLVSLYYLMNRSRLSRFAYGLPLLWSFALIAVYLVPRVRLPWYMFPLVPPMSLLMGALLTEYAARLPFRISLRITALLLLVPALVLGVLLWTTAFTTWQFACFLVAVVVLFVSAGCAWRGNIVGMTVAFAFFIIFLAQGVSALTDGRLPQNVALQLKNSAAPIAAARIETGRLSQQLWFFSYQTGRKVTEARSAEDITRFLAERGGSVLITETDLTALKLKAPVETKAVQVIGSWRYWKENISTEDIRAALLQGELTRLMEPVHLIRRRE